jgi:hypothetical protein
MISLFHFHPGWFLLIFVVVVAIIAAVITWVFPS